MAASDGVALITGASAGIGAAIARQLAGDGYRVAVTARRAERLERLADGLGGEGRALAVVADFGSAPGRERAFERVEDEWGRVDVLVNNAGFGHYARIEDTDEETVAQMLELNVAAPIHLARLALPGMRERDRGHIVNIASLAGHIAAPPLGVYATTKHALVGFSRSLHRELRGTGVEATVVSPGPVRTGFGRTASGRDVDPAKAPGGIDAERVARAVGRVLRRPRREIVVPAWYWPGVVAEYLAPWLIDRAAARQERAWMRAVERAGR